MHVPLTLAALALLTVILVLLRIRWPHLSPHTRSTFIACACATLALFVARAVTHWSPVSIRLNALCNWSGFAGYEFLIILFTLLRPRLLTSLIAAILILPILSASTLLPLTELFDHLPQTTTSLSDNLVSARTLIHRSSIAPDAADLEIYYRTAWLPHLQRRVQGTRFFDTQCDASRSFAVLQPDHKNVLLTCPALPTQPPTTAVVERRPIH